MADRPSVEEALAIVRASVSGLGIESIPASQSLGRRLAAPVTSTLNVPRFVSAAMDGYAVRSTDLQVADLGKPATLSLARSVQAGGNADVLLSGSAMPISTGAMVPIGADAIVTRESGRVIDRQLVLAAPPTPGTNIRQVGEDAAAGDQVLPAGARVTADMVGALAGYGVEQVLVVRLPKLLLFTTGNEIAQAGEALGPTQIIDSNGPMIAAFAATLGVEVQRIGCASDDAESIDTMLSLVASSMGDIIISTGGVSGGSYDLIRSRIEAAGARIGFHGVRMRPGKPMLFATLSDGRLFFGLPGNPVAAFICLRFFVYSAWRVLAGLSQEIGVAVSGDQVPRAGTTVFLRGMAISHAGSIDRVDTSCDQRSHVLSSLLRSDTLLRVDGEDDCGSALTAYPKIPEPL